MEQLEFEAAELRPIGTNVYTVEGSLAPVTKTKHSARMAPEMPKSPGERSLNPIEPSQMSCSDTIWGDASSDFPQP